MRQYSNIISLTKNARGVYSLDTVMGCESGMKNEKGGCFNDCYAAKSAKLYGYDFSQNVLRYFKNESHRRQIVNEINKAKLDFIRIGTNGDPSENWQHTFSIIDGIKNCNKQIVIITKHWHNMTEIQLNKLCDLNICVNTSVSALDKLHVINNSIEQYNEIKKYCKSILRVISADFNKDTIEGKLLSIVQDDLFKNDDVIDTVLRLNKNNQLLKSGILNFKKSKFLGKNAIISKYNKKTYFGKCSTCIEMCGAAITPKETKYPTKKGIIKQSKLF